MKILKKQLSVPSLAELSRRSGISREILRKWRADGVNIYDPEALAKRISEKQPSPHANESPPAHASGESYSEARRRREVAAANRLEALAAREAGDLVPLAEVKQTFMRLGSEMKSRLLMMRNNLVNELVGRDEVAVSRILGERINDLLQSIFEDRDFTES